MTLTLNSSQNLLGSAPHRLKEHPPGADPESVSAEVETPMRTALPAVQAALRMRRAHARTRVIESTRRVSAGTA